jgi:ferredoxin
MDAVSASYPIPEGSHILERQDLETLIKALQKRGYQILGPTVRDGAIVYDALDSATDLPEGWTDVQDAATYRLKRRNDAALFGYAVGPHSWKKYLHPPRERLWQAERRDGTMQITTERPKPQKLAFFGVRSCELRAIEIQDRVFLQGSYVDTSYQARRQGAFIVAVQCSQAGGTCFCASMQTGPKAAAGYDLALTEVLGDERHYFRVEVGSAAGAEVLGELPHRPARPEEQEAAERVLEATARQMGRKMETAGLPELLTRNYEHPRWQNVAGRCLTCANCTMVCPTCFCTTVEDTSDLKGEHAERWQRWDSCFTVDFSYLHGGSVRSSARARYRQWMTHKLATWFDQFGTSGCVGCGRCITWCPAAIDITEEVRAIRETEVPANHARKDQHGEP